MRSSTIFSILVAGAASVLGQTIEIGSPANGQVLFPGQHFIANIVQPESLASCIQVGIALAIDQCDGIVCPSPAEELGDVLYAGPWAPTPHNCGGFYQSFKLQVPETFNPGPAIFTLTHLCLLGAAPYPFLEFRNVSLTIAEGCSAW